MGEEKKYTIHHEHDVMHAFSEWENIQDFIVQECIVQHQILSSLNETSTNILRICSFRHDDTVDILYAAARVGIQGAITDVSFIDGQEQVRVLGVSKDGIFDNRLKNQDGFVVDTFKEKTAVPAWDKIVSIIKRNHLLIDNFDIIGWDFTVTEKGEPVCFEWNVQWPGTVLYQYVNGPLFGEMTDRVLSFLLDAKNRENYIPCYLIENGKE